MQNFSILDKLKILFDIMLSSPLFLCLSIAFIVFLVVLAIFSILNKKLDKWIYAIIWGISLLAIIVFYKDITLNIIDNFFDNIFMAIYFPNLSIYIVIIFVANFFFFYSLFNKKLDKSHKIVNIINWSILHLLLIFIISIVKQNNINVYERLTVYSNTYLLVLLELSTGTFLSWILLNLFISARIKLKKYDKTEHPKMPEIMFDSEKNMVI